MTGGLDPRIKCWKDVNLPGARPRKVLHLHAVNLVMEGINLYYRCHSF